jgi:hypothetical protein
MNELCKYCGKVVIAIRSPGTGPHYGRLDCSICGRFLLWVKHPPPEATFKQLAYIQRLGYRGPMPQSKMEASLLIDELLNDKGKV